MRRDLSNYDPPDHACPQVLQRMLEQLEHHKKKKHKEQIFRLTIQVECWTVICKYIRRKSAMKGEMKTIGLSSDGRTNVWRITLDCGHPFTPLTTMLSMQRVQCPKCGREALVDYNKNTISRIKEND